MSDLNPQRDLEVEVESLESLRKWLGVLIVLLVACIPILGYLFYVAEVGHNADVNSWIDALMFSLKQSTGADVSQVNPVTEFGNIIAVFLAIIELVLFALIVSVIMLSVEIRSKSSHLARRTGESK